ncbi:hypothetical protein WA026_018107 [Henosepilachna vigintioctopunctata]|uniref:Uncharacterized protein n=1 Tax=Henosepilachna vigintioctopunctata TaxID=420089 RepID=A0AAW1UN16_9CUCU
MELKNFGKTELKQKINELAEERKNMLTSIEVLSSENSVYQREQSARTQLGPSQGASDEFELKLCHKLQVRLYSRRYERIRRNILNELKERQYSQTCFRGADYHCFQEKDNISITEMRQKEVKAIIHDRRDKQGQIGSDLDIVISQGAGSRSVVKGSYAQVACSESKVKANKLTAVSGGSCKPGVYTDSSYGANKMLQSAPSKKKSSNVLLNYSAKSIQSGELLEGRSHFNTPALLQQ